jgi:hypothetical protein
MYTFVLLLHSWIRWAAVITGILATAAAFMGRSSEGSAQADRWGRFFVITLDVQMLLGLLLYFFLSPNTAAIFDDFGAAMRDPIARFWAVEHIALMVFAVAMAHIGQKLSRKARDAKAKQMRLMIFFTLATLAMLAAIPWPGMANGRPLFRF